MVKQRKAMPKPKTEAPEKLGLSKFVKKQAKNTKTKKEKNTYQFIGFYDRLKSIDVKVSHASLIDQSYRLDHLQQDADLEDLSQSNFIALIKQEKVNNSTLEFRMVWKELEHLAYSFPLVIINKQKLVKKLLQQLQTDTLKAAYSAIIELIIALIKDLRSDIYNEFMHQILPVVISILDCSNLQLLDAVFGLLSFSFKYLLNPIRDDLIQFYSVYVELLLHKNKFVRKFAAQSFSYVLRKVKFTPELVDLICNIKSENEILGTVELLYEVCSGETDSLHSKATEVLNTILSNEKFISESQGELMIRYLYLKLINSIDTKKQLPIFEILTERLELRFIRLLASVMNDSIKLKFSQRVSYELGKHFMKTLLEIMKSGQLQISDQELVTESLSLLYYFQYDRYRDVKQFTHQLYHMSDNAVKSFFQIFCKNANEITTETDLQISKVLEIKQSNKVTEFSLDSHSEKCWNLVPSLNKWALKALTYDRIALLMTIIDKSGNQIKIEIGGKCVTTLIETIKSQKTQIEMFTLAKFISICSENQKYVDLMKQQISSLPKENTDQIKEFEIDIKDNFVLNSYQPAIDQNLLMQRCSTFIDMQNVGYEKDILTVTKTYLQVHQDQAELLNPKNSQSLFILRKVIEQQVVPNMKNQKEICEALSLNLSKNSRELRIATLKVLNLFEPLDFKLPTQESKLDNDTIKQFYTGKCNIISLLLKAEECPISLETEKTKSNILRKVQIQLASELTPALYVQICYRYAIGCFWIKFSPLYQPSFDILEECFKNKQIVSDHLLNLDQLSLLMQLGENNDDIISNLHSNFKSKRVQPNSLQNQLYIQDTTAEQDFVQIKDFHYNLTKCMYTSIDFILQDQQLRGQLMQIYFLFMEFEYAPLHFGRQTKKLNDFHQTVIASNQTDSAQFKAARRISYSKLCAIFELLSKSSQLNKLNSQQSKLLIDNYLELLQTADDKLQKTVLSGLLKISKKQDFENKTVKLPKYQKLLEGLCDDLKYKDMIPIIAFGSSIEHEETQVNEEEQKKNKTSESIPKLANEDRMEVLPVIIKLLFSKLLKKRGVLNKKSLQQRRNIIYQFLSGLDPASEFPIFFKELLEPLGLQIENSDQEYISEKLTLVSFSQFIQFIGSVEIIFTQLGSLLNRDTYLISLTNILILMLSQAKRFLGHMNEVEVQEEGLYQFVQRQCRMCVRKGLKILKNLYSKFSFNNQYKTHLSTLFYNELVKDQVKYFKERYISDKAQLIEIVTESWSTKAQENYLLYPDVLPALMQMLLVGKKIESQVFSLHFQMLKNLVVSSIDSDAERLRYIQVTKFEEEVENQSENQSDEEMSNSNETELSVDEEVEPQLNYSQVAIKVLQQNIQVISEGLFAFWETHSSKLRHALMGSSKSSFGQQSKHSKQQIKENIAMTNAVRDLTFIMSELSGYLDKESPYVNNFLEMMIGLVGQKQLLGAVSNFQQKSRLEELLMFGCQAITKLLSSSTDQKNQERISEMFLNMQSKKAREVLAKGLNNTYNTNVTQILLDLNTVKKGQADIDYDYDKVLGGIQAITKLQSDTVNINVLLYCILSLLQHQEFSVREYSLHALNHLLTSLDERLFKLCETSLLQGLKIIKDEMIMKSILMGIRALVLHSKKVTFKCAMQDLAPLINEEHEDFFTQILSLQLPQRLKSLRKIQNLEIAPHTFSRALLPLVDYLIFDMKNQMENRRNIVRYSRDQSNLLQEESLSVYTAYAQKLKWGQYMSLVRKLLYKIEKATRQQNGVAAQKYDSQNEKVICKCLCKVLEGFNFKEVPDAVQLLQKTIEEKVAHKFEIVEYSDFLKEMVGNTIMEVEDIEEHDSQQSDSEREEIAVDLKKAENDADKIEDIQSKLLKKVLPLLQRHILQKKGENTTIRSFVAVAIAKVIRKLPIDQFSLHLQKLINLIVVKGLREKDLNTREKARKALIKVIGEVSPRFLTLILQEMGNNLTRGFQLHVYLYTVHYVFNYMKDQMKSGQITTQMIRLISPLLLREMFGDLLEERKAAEDTAKKHIKESKAKKAMPIYEVFAQFIDFKTSFLELIQPIVKVLEDNPSHSAIQMTEDLLARIANSVLKNTSITGQKLLPFLRQIIEKGVEMSKRLKINDEKAKRDYGAKADADYVQKSKGQLKLETHEVQIKWTKASQLASDRKTQEICGRVLANFGLQTLKKALNQKGLVLQGDEFEERASKTISQKQELIQMLDPFVQPLLDSFKTFYNPIVVQTLQIMIHVIHLGLPSFKTLLRKFLNRIFKLFNTNSQADNDFANSLFKCTSELIRTYSVYNDLSELQIKTLVQIIKANVTNFSTQSSVFTCLKAILHRRFQCADLYDLMTSIQDMMVTSVQQSTRYTCAQIFITFILEYPMEEKRLEQHIQHILKNLSYFDAEGRQQLLETLQILVEKMPEQKIDSWSDLMFLTLFLRLVNESSSKCRDIVTHILKKLVLKSKKRYVDTVFQMQDDSEVLTNGKLQLLTLMAECGKLQKQDIQKTVDLLAGILSDAAERSQLKLDQGKQESDDDMAADKITFLKNIGLDSEDEKEQNLSQDQEQLDESKWSNVYFSVNCLENIFVKCNQTQVLNQIIDSKQNLKLNIITLMWKSNNYWVRLSCQRVIGFILQQQQSLQLSLNISTPEDVLKFMYKLLSVLNFSFVTEELCNQLILNLVVVLKQIDADSIVKVFKKASYIGRRILGEKSDQTSLKHVTILKFYKNVLQYLHEKNLLEICCGAMLEFVYRTYTDDQLPAVVRDISTELVDQMSSSLDKDVFIRIFNQVQMQVTQNRTERKMKDKMMVSTEIGLQRLAKKRAKKIDKNKAKHKQKVLMNALTR